MESISTTSTERRSRYERGLAIADRRPGLRGYSYVERAAHLGGDDYAVPSCTRTGVRYRVNLEHGICTCPDHHRGHVCKHLYCAMILASRRRTRLAGVAG